MRITQHKWLAAQGWESGVSANEGAQLVLVFGVRALLSSTAPYAGLRALYPDAEIVLCSTAGEILGSRVLDQSIVATAIRFASTAVRTVKVDLNAYDGQRAAGKALASALEGDGLRLLFVLCDGRSVNGSEFSAGLNEGLSADVPITGGLAGDYDQFSQTVLGLNAVPASDQAIGIGFYGDRLQVGHGSIGGWDAFGPERIVTRSDGNVLYELDGESALSLYKRYLGELASGLPGTALRFPLSVQVAGDPRTLVRTVLDVHEDSQSMVFAGDIPQGARVRLMNANLERLIDAAESSANASLVPLSGGAELALLVSCIGRKILLGQRVEEEVEAAQHVLGDLTAITGFYSYGELSPLGHRYGCALHNQTLTITTLAER
jgi:hypothetical protein